MEHQDVVGGVGVGDLMMGEGGGRGAGGSVKKKRKYKPKPGSVGFENQRQNNAEARARRNKRMKERIRESKAKGEEVKEMHSEAKKKAMMKRMKKYHSENLKGDKRVVNVSVKTEVTYDEEGRKVVTKFREKRWRGNVTGEDRDRPISRYGRLKGEVGSGPNWVMKQSGESKTYPPENWDERGLEEMEMERGVVGGGQKESEKVDVREAERGERGFGEASWGNDGWGERKHSTEVGPPNVRMWMGQRVLAEGERESEGESDGDFEWESEMPKFKKSKGAKARANKAAKKRAQLAGIINERNRPSATVTSASSSDDRKLNQIDRMLLYKIHECANNKMHKSEYDRSVDWTAFAVPVSSVMPAGVESSVRKYFEKEKFETVSLIGENCVQLKRGLPKEWDPTAPKYDDKKVNLVQTEKEMTDAVEKLRVSGNVLGVDTEGENDHLNSLQVADVDSNTYIFDILHNQSWVTSRESPLRQFLESTNQVLFFQGTAEIGHIPLKKTESTFNLLLQIIRSHNIFDLTLAAKQQGRVDVGHNSIMYGVRVPINLWKGKLKKDFKKPTHLKKTFFERVPAGAGLTKEDKEYAALDVYYMASHVYPRMMKLINKLE